MPRHNQENIESLVLAGIIGATFGALISKNKTNGSGLGAIAGIAFWASLSANEKARKTQIPLLLEENDALYEVYPNGKKKLITHFEKQDSILPKKFILR